MKWLCLLPAVLLLAGVGLLFAPPAVAVIGWLMDIAACYVLFAVSVLAIGRQNGRLAKS